MTARRRIAVLASGGGSNLQAIIDHLAALGERRGGDVVVVAAGKETAGALERARRAGIATAACAPGALGTLLDEHRADLVVLAGYLSLVPEEVTTRWAGRMLNVHPALLPAFGGHGLYGARVHRAVIESGARVSGVTVHFVDAHYDRGPIVAQWPVPVLAGDDEHSLAARVLKIEHLLYPRVVDAVARGAIALDAGGRVRGAFDAPVDAPAFTITAAGEAAIAEQIDALLRS
ncbi:MAG TPA: phosphoribosylglycinamide formyltransferase [Gemmatimonadaceae bacterium]